MGNIILIIVKPIKISIYRSLYKFVPWILSQIEFIKTLQRWANKTDIWNFNSN